MCSTSIPFFKEIIVMAFTCSFCGARSTEVKGQGEITKLGKEISLRVTEPIDLRRDIFKSETAKVTIPELELEL
jgi:zinc finger protein